MKIFFLLLGLVLFSFPSPGRGAAPVLYVSCADKADFMASANAVPPRLWQAGVTWSVQECDEKTWPAACRLGAALSNPRQSIDPSSTDGFTLMGNGPGTTHMIYIRRFAPDKVPAPRIFCHELGHIVWASLVADPNVRGGQAYFEQMVDFYGKGKPQSFSPGTCDAEEAFANAFEINLFNRAAAGSDWGQEYIDGILNVWDGDSDAVASSPAK